MAPDGWGVTKPYANNPLREASIAGTVRVGETTEPSSLTVGCRADDEGAVMTASFVSPDTLDFPFGDFEGPGGVGGNEPAKIWQSKSTWRHPTLWCRQVCAPISVCQTMQRN